jgi:hypothetical protein
MCAPQDQAIPVQHLRSRCRYLGLLKSMGEAAAAKKLVEAIGSLVAAR